jgi:hypothetical protein
MTVFQRYFRGLIAMATIASWACTGRQTPAPVPEPSTPAPALASASVIARDTAALVREYRGSYTSGFEMSWFEPCDAPLDDRMWWVTLTGEALEQRDSLLAKITRPKTSGLAVRWRGTISPRMPAGHMGRGTRYMLVTEILDIRPLPSEGACTPTSKAS